MYKISALVADTITQQLMANS